MSALPGPIEEESLTYIKNEFKVQAKLGYGATSTTWLCAYKNSSFKVMKLATANQGDTREARVFKHLHNHAANSQNPGRYCVRQPEDIFTIIADGHHHQCFIFEPLGPSLLEFSSWRTSQSFHIEEVRRMIIYILHAVHFLHEHNVIHTGDLDIKLDNIQITLPDDEEDILKALVASEKESPSFAKMSPDGFPLYRSREMRQDELTYPILCDLGSAKVGSPPHTGTVQALPYRAPEVLLGSSWDSKIDIWSLGVLVWELALGERLFGQSNEVETVKLMLQYLGPPPANFLLRCAAKDKHFDELGNLKHGEPEQVSLEERVDMEPEHAPFFDFLRHMLRWDPEQRASASELLKHSWLQFE
ncbi:Serine/threonine protein [Sphaerulina musiva]